MAACCGCCSALRPRYKRLVDNIFPDDPQEGLIKSNMEKLTFFAMKSPEKLDRIGDYLAQRLSRDVSRQRTGYVRIAMEALDNLLLTCHHQSLNLFVESFLRMVQKLLECHDPKLQTLATQSFIKFANIEEDTPSYHRRYDFFVSKFSSMCHNNQADMETRTRLRIEGLRGLQGVVRKTVSDDLQANIWDKTHMDKIVPSLLFNMQDTSGLPVEPDSPNEGHPSVVAETVFRDLICRASFGNIQSVIKPVLVHLDHHKLWVSSVEFPSRAFKIIMYAVQAQYGYFVVQMLMNHLDDHSKDEPKVKASIVDVLSRTVVITAGGSIGPSVLEVFNTLLKHLRVSVDIKTSDKQRLHEEKSFQEAVIETIGEFANNLPDYQKIEILMFVMGKVPLPATDEDMPGDTQETQLQLMLMKTLLKVATKYKTVLITNAFPSDFLEPLIRMSLVNDPGVRLLVQEILHTLIDRHDNSSKLKAVRIPKDIAQLDLSVEKPPRQDVMFMKKNGSLLYWHILENIQKGNNRVAHFEHLYCTMALLCLEMSGDEVLIDLFRLALGIQDLGLNTPLPVTHKCAVQALAAAYLNLMSQLTAIPALIQHVTSVIELRKKEAPFYLPDVAFNRTNRPSSEYEQDYPRSENIKPEWLFDVEVISDALGSSGQDTARLDTPFMPKPYGLDMVDLSKSTSDIGSVSINLDTPASTPGAARRSIFEEEDVTFESLKKILENSPEAKEAEERRRREILESFRSAPFEEIVARSEAKNEQLQNHLNKFLDPLSDEEDSRYDEVTDESPTIPEMKYPPLFVY